MARTMVVSKREDEAPDGEGVGPVWIDTCCADPDEPEKSEKFLAATIVI